MPLLHPAASEAGRRQRRSRSSRDPAVPIAYNEDPLVLRKVTVKLGKELLNSLKFVERRIKDIKIPILLQKGSNDPVVTKFDELVKEITADDCVVKVYDGLFHEVYNELEEDRELVLADLVEWLDNHL